MHIEEQLSCALRMWLDLSEVDPNASSFSIRLDGGMDSYTVYTMHKAIKEALELDPSNITGILMLDALSSLYFKHRHFSVEELMVDPARASAYVAKAGELTNLVRSPEITHEKNRFISGLRTALKMYSMDTPAVLALLEDSHELAYLRRDAFKSIQNLRVDQFLAGQNEPVGTLPVYHRWVHQFWNVNTLIQAACSQPAGVTLNLIRDPDDLQSYFAFAIRNGGNLFLLSDVPVHTHPLQKYMSRRPERSYASRTAKNWFPYDLLGLKFDEDAKAFFADQTKRRALVPLQQTFDKARALEDLSPHEVLWTIMMFDLIVERFWHKGYQAPALSYTGQMVREETPLLDAAKTANLPVKNYQTLGVKPLTLADMNPAKMPDGALGKFEGVHSWLEQRYADKIDPQVLNLLDAGGHLLYLPPVAGTEDSEHHKNHELAVITGEIVSVEPKIDEQRPFWEKKGRYQLHALGTTTFGTREELEKNRLYLARYNQAIAIQRLADAEFNARKEEVLAWWKARLLRNKDYLLSLVGQDHIQRSYRKGVAISAADGWYTDTNSLNFMKVHTSETYPRYGVPGTMLHGGYDSARREHTCWVTGARWTYRALFQPQTPDDLAELAGCLVSDLPDVLQHWSRKEHSGNHLLDRLDPMDWALRNPWAKLRLNVVICLSKRGLAHCQKQHKLKNKTTA